MQLFQDIWEEMFQDLWHFAAQVKAMPSYAQKNFLGARLFPMIEKQPGVGEQAGKITGMLLDMDTDDLLNLIESPEALRAKVKEAIEVLEVQFFPLH